MNYHDYVPITNEQRSIAEEIGVEVVHAYTWTSPDGTTLTWSIDEALKLIGDRPPIKAAELPPEYQRQALASNDLSNDIDMEYTMTTDLSRPLIAVVSPIEFSPGNIVLVIIDGWHRIKHSVAINNPNALPVHVLTPAEELACRMVRRNP